ncbi:signal recognition particle receptor FtsY [Eubacterium sp. CAG:274]|mgnify:FL=1|nr:signal recognition particle receptor FtsY [Eubacterium sp. CAG:274]
MGFFKWFKKKKENAPVENTQANEVEVSVTEESNVEETQTVKENQNEDVVEAVVSTDDEVEVVEESVDETETIAEEVSEIEEIEDTVEKEEVAVENTVEEIKEEEQAVVEDVKEVENAVEKVENEVEENHTESTTEGIVEEVTKENDTTVEEVEIKEITTEENNVVEKTEVEEAVQEIPEENVEPVEVEETEEVAVEEQPTEEEKPKGFFAKIKAGLSKTRNNIISSVENVLSAFTKIDEDLYEELEEALIMADIGVETSLYIIEKLREKVKDEKIHDPAEVKGAIIRVITEILEKDDEPFELPHPSVVLVIGVNGVGKTTTIGKLTHNYMENGKTVLLAAADTFRAAAIDQLQVWADRNNAQLIKHQENSDPGAVVYDAVQAAKARNTDVLICDTAGRLHNKKNLMEELRKISKIVNKEYPDAKVETLLVLDATTGQNALQQAKLFKEVADITGLVLTKLDGTAKGGIVLAIKHEMNIPVRYIGVGEQMDDLQEFNSKDFAKALFGEE